MTQAPQGIDNPSAAADRGTSSFVAPDGAWRHCLVVGFLLTAAHTAIPYGSLTSLIYVLTTALAALGVALGVRMRRQLFQPTAWCLIAGALALAACGHAIWYILDLRGLEPFPSLADVFYLAVYPLFGAALWMLGKKSWRGDGALSDAMIVGVSAAVLGWGMIIAPYHKDAALSLLELLVLTAYPVGDLILLPLILRLVFLHRTRIRAHLFLLIGMSAYLAADMLYAHGNSAGWYAPGGFTDALWLVAYVFMVAAIWHPSATVEPTATVSSAELSGRRLALLGAAAVIAAAVNLLTANVEIVRVAATGSIVIFVLILHRMAGLMRETHRQADALELLSRTDPLTGAANRRCLDDELAREIYRAKRTGSPLAVAFLDLDHFKRFNDTQGHPAGDALLRELVRAWQPLLRHSDVLARFGGEEFVAVLPDTTAEEAWKLVDRMRQATPRDQTCSAGIAQLRPDDTAACLLKRADSAMYTAKHEGRNRVCFENGGSASTEPAGTSH